MDRRASSTSSPSSWSRSASFSAPSFDLVSLLVYHLRPVSFPPSLKKEKGNQSYKRTDKAILNIKKRKKIKRKSVRERLLRSLKVKKKKKHRQKHHPACVLLLCVLLVDSFHRHIRSLDHQNAPYRSSFSSLSFRTPSLCESSLQ